MFFNSTKRKILNSSHILICRTDNIGDVVLTLPMVARLKQLNPSCKISFLCRAYAAPVVRYCTSVDEVIEFENIRDNLENYFSTSTIDTILIAQPERSLAKAAFKARIKNRIGNARQKIYLLLYCNRRVRFSKGLSENHEAQINFEFLRVYGDTHIPSREEIPALYHFAIPDDAQITNLLAPYTFNLILHTKSNGHGREWPIQHYQTLAESLLDNDKVHILLTGSPQEGKWLESHAPGLLALPNVQNVCGQFSLAQLTILIKNADGLIASGTGPLHLSAAIGQRTLGLFPPTRPMHPGRWAALGTRAEILCNNSCATNCRHSQDNSCDCMYKISPDSVRSIVMRWIQDKIKGKVTM